jgi:hypothetical protein
MRLHTYRKHRKIGIYISVFLDIEEALGSISRYITMAAERHGFGDNLAMDWLHAEWQKNYSHIDRRNVAVVYGQVLSAQGHFITL